MAKSKVKVAISPEMKKKLLTAANGISDEAEKDLILTILNSTDEVEVEIEDDQISPLLRGPAQHVAHQISN